MSGCHAKAALLNTHNSKAVYILIPIAVAPAAMFRRSPAIALRGTFSWLLILPLNGGSLPRRLLASA
jgi:hypothetical protein